MKNIFLNFLLDLREWTCENNFAGWKMVKKAEKTKIFDAQNCFHMSIPATLMKYIDSENIMTYIFYVAGKKKNRMKLCCRWKFFWKYSGDSGYHGFESKIIYHSIEWNIWIWNKYNLLYMIVAVK